MIQILTIILLLITLCVVKYYKDQKTFENFDTKITNTLYSTDHTDISTKNVVPYIDMNSQQMIYREIVLLFKELSSSSKSKQLNNITSKQLLKPETLSVREKNELNQITLVLLNKINQKSQFNFINTGYDNVLQIKDNNNNVQYEYDLFITEPVESIQLRIKTNIIKYTASSSTSDNSIKTCAEETTPDFPTYPMGYPQNHQYLPLPSQVIPSANDIIGNKGINFNEPSDIKEIHINYVRIYNSNTILNADELCINNNLQAGTNSTSLENMPFHNDCRNNPCQLKAEEYNKWIPVPTEHKYNPNHKDCSLNEFVWDSNGVMIKPENECKGINAIPFTAEYNPTLNELPRFEDNFASTFSRVNQNLQNKNGI